MQAGHEVLEMPKVAKKTGKRKMVREDVSLEAVGTEDVPMQGLRKLEGLVRF